MQKRHTLQRQLVLDAIKENQTHPTAETVYEAVSRKYKNISLATVYRNLNSLAQDGEIHKIALPGGADRFDCNTYAHYHLLCHACGRFEDAPVEYLDALRIQAQEKSGFLIDGYDIVFTGICPDCAQKADPAASEASPDDERKQV